MFIMTIIMKKTLSDMFSSRMQCAVAQCLVLFGVSATPAFAQTGEEWVHDVVEVNDFFTKAVTPNTPQTWTVEKDAATYAGYSNLGYEFIGETTKTNKYFVFNYQVGNLKYITTTASKGVVREVRLTTFGTLSDSGASLDVYGSEAPFDAEAMKSGAAQSGATLLGTLTTDRQTCSVTGDYPYVCLRATQNVGNNRFHVSTIDFAWDTRATLSEGDEEEDWSTAANGTVSDGKFRRSGLSTTDFQTLCLPRNVAAGDLDGVTPYIVHYKEPVGDSGKGYIVYYIRQTDIHAGEPYVFLSSKPSITLRLSGETVEEGRSRNGLCGTFEKYEFRTIPGYTTGTYHVIRGNKIRPATAESGAPAYCCYFDLDEVPNTPGQNLIEGSTVTNDATPAPAQIAVLAIDAPVTAIENLNLQHLPADLPLYDLSGRRLTPATGTANGGITLQGNRKVIR